MPERLKGSDHRTPDHDIERLFLDRWSPRGFTGEEIAREELLRLFEAARWAPSSMNNQPWRFVYALRDTEHWERFFGLLSPGNQVWCRNASALIVVLSKTTFDYNGKPSRTHSFDAGAAWMSLALQAWLAGLAAHGMQGFSYDRAKTLLALPDEYQVEAMIAVGRPGPAGDLPEDVRKREAPSQRRKLGELVFEGTFPAQTTS